MALNTWTFWLMSICLLWSWGKILSKNWTDNKVVYFVKLNDTRLFITYNSTGFCNDSSELESMISIKTETFSWKVKKKIVRVDADGSLLFLSKWHTKKNLTICIEAVKQTNGKVSTFMCNMYSI
ncbi:hypothetical protein NQD34_017686 [Periophthalmus magnuspinnatus]|nr:hypothetical protein NQD34_017686 [Periophthalmus magnuspinnatus]